MAEPTTVYAVFRDDYDDHEIAAMFATRELADAHAADLNDPGFKRRGWNFHEGGWEVEEHQVLAHQPERGSSCTFRGDVMPDGKLVGVSHYQQGDWDYERAEESVSAQLLPGGHTVVRATAHSEATARARFDGAVEQVREVYAADPERAAAFAVAIEEARQHAMLAPLRAAEARSAERPSEPAA